MSPLLPGRHAPDVPLIPSPTLARPYNAQNNLVNDDICQAALPVTPAGEARLNSAQGIDKGAGRDRVRSAGECVPASRTGLHVGLRRNTVARDSEASVLMASPDCCRGFSVGGCSSASMSPTTPRLPYSAQLAPVKERLGCVLELFTEGEGRRAGRRAGQLPGRQATSARSAGYSAGRGGSA